MKNYTLIVITKSFESLATKAFIPITSIRNVARLFGFHLRSSSKVKMECHKHLDPQESCQSITVNLLLFNEDRVLSISNCSVPRFFQATFYFVSCVTSERALQSPIICFAMSAASRVQTGRSFPLQEIRRREVRVPNSHVLSGIPHLLPHIINNLSLIHI